MIIFGIDSKRTTQPVGTFRCPVGETSRPFAELQQARRFTLFFIPVIPLGSSNSGRLVCTHCGSEFDKSQIR